MRVVYVLVCRCFFLNLTYHQEAERIKIIVAVKGRVIFDKAIFAAAYMYTHIKRIHAIIVFRHMQTSARKS
jgi:hypothetical protein